MNVILDADPHGYTEKDDEQYYWVIEDGEVNWRHVDHDTVPHDVRTYTEYKADANDWIAST